MKLAHKSWKKIKALVIALGMILVLTGCDETKVPVNLQHALNNAFQARAQLNEKVAKDLYDSGIITDKTYESLKNTIASNTVAFAAKVKDLNDASGKALLKSVTGWRVIPESVLQEDGSILYYLPQKGKLYSEDATSEWSLNYLSNVLLMLQECWDAARNNAPILGGNSKSVNPIQIISQSLIDELNNAMSIDVYVLKTDVSDGVGLDGLMEAVRQAADTKSSSPLTNYFELGQYTNDKGEKKNLTLLDPTNEDEQIVRMTKGYYPGNDGVTLNTVIDHHYSGSGYTSIPAEATFTNNHRGGFDTYNMSVETAGMSDKENRLGYDMILKMGPGISTDSVGYEGEPVMTIRLVEFNQDAIDTLMSKIGVGEQRYLVIENKAYLMEYPVGYIKAYKETNDRQDYKAVIEQSQLGFNLLTGNWSKFGTDESGEYTNTSSTFDKEDPYLTYDGALSNTDTSRASLILQGSTGITKDGVEEDEFNPCWNLVFGEYTTESGEKKDRIYNTGRIVLRDYLEATYAPGVVNSDSLVVLGRKMRLNIEGSKKEPIATFYNKDGTELENSAKIYIQDLADIPAIYESSQKIKYISGYQEEIGDVSGGTTSDTDTSGADQGDSSTESDDSEDSDTTSELDEFRDTLSKVDSIPTEIVSEISPTTKFPGKNIGYVDYDESDSKPLFYAMFVRANMFQTGLYSGWVTNTDTTQNSTVWWNNWLTAHGYTYRINTDNLVNYLKGNYAYDLAQEGVIILDLDTIAKIQQDFNNDDKVETAHGLRTIFMVFGYILIGYAIILLISWNLDVNVDFGFNVLEKLSFGKWIAIKDYDEMPYVNTTETNFIKFSELLLSCIIIISIGLVLILVNVVDIILMIIQLFGGFASYISKMITGV